MLYFDTSFLVPLILPEKTSNRIAAFIRALPSEQLTVSHWTHVEFSSLIAREVRMGGLRAGDALHLAVARNHGAGVIYSLDKILLKAGTMLGLSASMGVQTR